MTIALVGVWELGHSGTLHEYLKPDLTVECFGCEESQVPCLAGK